MNARRYLTLSMSRPKQDLFATQFVRFQQFDRLIFCEFASYILAPALKRFYIMDRLFHINAALFYNLVGLPILLGATLLCLFDYLILGVLTAWYGAATGAGLDSSLPGRSVECDCDAIPR